MPPKEPASGTAQGLLGQWLELSELERRAFMVMIRELTASSSIVERSAIDLSQRFQILAESATAQLARVETIVRIARSIDVAGTQVPLSEATQFIEQVLVRVIDRVLTVSKHAMRMVYSLDDVARKVEGVEECVAQIHAINKQTRFLALNAAIEAQRAGKEGAAFSVIAREIKDLSSATDRTAQTVNERILAVALGVRHGHAVLQDIATMDMSEHIIAKERLDALLHGMIAQNEAFNLILAETAAASADLAGVIGPMIVGMQFQDRTTQRLSHVAEALGVLQEATESLQRSTHEALPGVFEANQVDTAWLERIVDRQTLGSVRKRFLKQLVGNEEAAEEDTASDGDIELF